MQRRIRTNNVARHWSLALAASLGLASPFASAEITTAYLLADRPEERRYTPAAEHLSAPGTVQIERRDPEVRRGRYRVFLGSQGNVQVSAVSEAGGTCQLESWNATSIDVACFDRAGGGANLRFALLTLRAATKDPVVYALVSRSPTGEFRADATRSLAPTPVTVVRESVGTFKVSFGDAVARLGGNAQVTAVNAEPHTCGIVRFASGEVTVSCRNARGAPADTGFSVMAAKFPAAERRFAYTHSAFPDRATAPANPFYSLAPEIPGGARVRRVGPGNYEVDLGARLHHLIVTANVEASGSQHCTLSGWTPIRANVRCFVRGTAADAKFFLFASNSDRALGGREAFEPLFGFIDLHTHPASYLGFGGREDGRSGMMWGVPAVGAYRGQTASQRFAQCSPDDHTEGDASIEEFLFDAAYRDDKLRHLLKQVVIGTADGRTGHIHGVEGARATGGLAGGAGGSGGSPSASQAFRHWPHSLVVSHQQMDVPWLERAHAGGLRVLVAAAVDNEVVTRAHQWGFEDIRHAIEAFFAGGDVREVLSLRGRAPGSRERNWLLNSAIRQLEVIQQMVRENPDFMELALTSSQARDIVRRGKLAIVLGVEMDNLSPGDMRTLVNVHGVRFVTPIHFVDNDFGGAAAYETIFSLLSGLIGRTGQLFSLESDATVDYRMERLFGELSDPLEREIRAGLGWTGPIGENCPGSASIEPNGHIPACVGKRNASGLTEEGERLIRFLTDNGAFVDVAHMSQASQQGAIALAETLQCPLVNSHTGVRTDEWELEATERSMRASDARKILDLGGVIGIGTGPGEYSHPRRIYYNSGNPLIDFRNGRSEWSLDLVQPEVRATMPDFTFTEFFVTLRIGRDDLRGSDAAGSNSLQVSLGSTTNTYGASLPDRFNAMARCTIPGGIPGHTVRETRCVSDSPLTFSRVNALKIESLGRFDSNYIDNVAIDEVIVKVRPPGREPVTLLQRTGGYHSEVAFLRGYRAVEPFPAIINSHYWITRLLPDASLFRDRRFSGVVVSTYTNEDDLGRSRPGVLTASLKGRGRSPNGGPLRLEFAPAGLAEFQNGGGMLPFPSGREGLLTLPDRAPDFSFGDITLTMGPEDRSLLEMLDILKVNARDGNLDNPDIDEMLGGALALTVFKASTTSTNYDNWSTYVALDLASRDVGGPTGIMRYSPLLRGYNPMQRLKEAQNSSTLFRGLPERIEENRRYAGVVVSFSMTSQSAGHVDQGDYIADGWGLQFEIEFADRSLQRVNPFGGVRLDWGKEYKAYLPFDMPRNGRDLKFFRVKIVDPSPTRPYLIRSMDIGLASDPMESFAKAYARIDRLGTHTGQLGFGTDLSGFEALVPFSAFHPGTNSPTFTTDPATRVRTAGTYTIDTERISGRPDPARRTHRAADGTVRSPVITTVPLRRGAVDGTPLDFRQRGLSTVGQLPELAVTAHAADVALRGTAANLGPEIFKSADAFVRAWERIDRFDVATQRCLLPVVPGVVLPEEALRPRDVRRPGG